MRNLIQSTFNSMSITSAITSLKQNTKVIEWAKAVTTKYSPKNISHALYIVLYGPPPKCEFGNYLQFNTFNKGYRKGCVLGNKCKCVTNHRRANQKITLLEKYGVDELGKIPHVITKRKATMLERYGVEYSGQSAELTQKRLVTASHRTEQQLLATATKTKTTNRQKYGVDHHMQLASQQAKVKTTNLERYGANTPLQNKEIKAKFIATLAMKTEINKNNPKQDHSIKIVSEEHPVWLCIKQHNVTGLKYFCKTTKKNPHKYLGSGIYWQNHLRVHGKDITTIWAQRFTNKDTLVSYALQFSHDNDIVNSSDWANLEDENGLDGGSDGRTISESTRAKMKKSAQEREERKRQQKNSINNNTQGH